MTDSQPSAALDAYLPEDVRAILEERFWQPVQDISTLEAVTGDETLASAPDRPPSLFAAHGIVHARDVTAARSSSLRSRSCSRTSTTRG